MTREEAFEGWLKVADIPLPVEPMAREIAVEALKRAFNAGWELRVRTLQ